MNRLLTSLLAGLIWVLICQPVTASEPVGPEDAAEIRAVIEGQLDALQRDDWAEAFSYAAPFIQRKFGSPDGFRRMVLGGYTIVHRPSSVSFEDLGDVGGRLAQKVFMVGPDGNAAIVVYFMTKMEDGNWRIAGVTLLAVADQSA